MSLFDYKYMRSYMTTQNIFLLFIQPASKVLSSVDQKGNLNLY